MISVAKKLTQARTWTLPDDTTFECAFEIQRASTSQGALVLSQSGEYFAGDEPRFDFFRHYHNPEANEWIRLTDGEDPPEITYTPEDQDEPITVTPAARWAAELHPERNAMILAARDSERMNRIRDGAYENVKMTYDRKMAEALKAYPNMERAAFARKLMAARDWQADGTPQDDKANPKYAILWAEAGQDTSAMSDLAETIIARDAEFAALSGAMTAIRKVLMSEIDTADTMEGIAAIDIEGAGWPV